jgi:hypothetical protein
MYSLVARRFGSGHPSAFLGDGVSEPTKLTAVRPNAPAVRTKARLMPLHYGYTGSGTSLIYAPPAVAFAF